MLQREKQTPVHRPDGFTHQGITCAVTHATATRLACMEYLNRRNWNEDTIYLAAWLDYSGSIFKLVSLWLFIQARILTDRRHWRPTPGSIFSTNLANVPPLSRVSLFKLD